MAYALRVEELDRAASTATLAAVLARTQGADIDVPDLGGVHAEFDRLLAEEPAPVRAEDEDKTSRLRALGLRPALAGR